MCFACLSACCSSLSFWAFLRLVFNSCSSCFASLSSTYRGQQQQQQHYTQTIWTPSCRSRDGEAKCLLTVHGSISICAWMWVIKELRWTLAPFSSFPDCNPSSWPCRFVAHERLYLELNVLCALNNSDSDVLWLTYSTAVSLAPELHFEFLPLHPLLLKPLLLPLHLTAQFLEFLFITLH